MLLTLSACGMQNIESVAVDGEFLMENGVVTVVPDEEAVLREGQRIAERLVRRAGIRNRGAGHPWKT